MKQQHASVTGPQQQESTEQRVRVVRHIPLSFSTETNDYQQGGGLPIKEGMRAPASQGSERTLGAHRILTGDIETTGMRVVYVLARDLPGQAETPVFDAQEAGDAVAVFSGREPAVLYLQVARWDQYRVEDLTPDQLGHWLNEARGEGIKAALVDPNLRDQDRGVPQPRVTLEDLADYSGENVYREVMAQSKTRPPV